MALDFTPSLRSVYFNSLATHPGYQSIYNRGLMQVQSFKSLTQQITNKNNRFEIALKILENGIVQERNAEQQYINNLLSNPILKDIPELKNEFEQIFSNDAIDYIGFVNLLNKILLGTDNYKSIIRLEQRRLEELDHAMNELRKTMLEKYKAREQNRKNQTKIKSENELKHEIEMQLHNIYLQQHGYSDSIFKDFFTDITPTIDNLLSKYVQEAVETVLKSDELLKNFTEGWIASKSSNTLQITILNSILNQINTKLPDIVNKVLQSNNFDTKSEDIINSLIEQAQNNISSLNIAGEEIFQKGGFKNIKIKKDKIETGGEQLAAQILEIYRVIPEKSSLYEILQNNVTKKSKNTIFEALQQLEKLIETATEIEKNKISIEGEEIINIEQLKKNIAKQKELISKAIHKGIKDKINAATTKAAQVESAKTIQKAFTTSSIKITGPQFSEIIEVFVQQLSQNSKSFFSGPKNQKADVITITVNAKSPFDLKDAGTEISKEITENVKELITSNISQFYQDFTSELHTNEGFSLKRGKEAWFNAIDKNMKELTTKISTSQDDEEERAKKLVSFVNQIKDTLIITETMKTFNQYNNKLGFVGGTLGSTITAQLENVQELFTSAGAGFSGAELTLLEVALVNCSDETLGSSNRPALEKFLSTLVTFAMFDEGSAEVEMIANSMTNNYVATSPKIMHIYKLNGLYFPGSYILQRVFDHLQKNLEQWNNETNNDGVHIYARASEALIGSHNIDSGAERWARVYEAALDSNVTSIEVTFLSNLMDIINQLTNLNNI